MYNYQLETLFLVNQVNQLKSKVEENEATINYLQELNDDLTDQSKLLNTIVSNSRDLILRHAPDGEILFASPSCLNITGFLANELIGNNIFNLVYKEDLSDFESIWQHESALRSVKTVRFRIVHKYKGPRWVEAKRKILERNNGQIYREVISWVSDIESEIKREEGIVNLLNELNNQKSTLNELSDLQSRTILKLKKKEREIMELNRFKNRIISIVAHDLKNPFGTLQNMTEMIMGDHDSLTIDDLNSICEHVHYSVVKANTLLEDLVNWAQHQSTKVEVKFEEIELKRLIDDSWQIYKPGINRKQLEIINMVTENRNIYSDKNILATVLRNIISNAVKYSKIGGKIIIKNHQDDMYELIEIEDEGIGMNQEDVYKINNLFSPASKLGTLDEKGSGIGLMIISELLPKINGILSVESKIGTGTTFQVRILNTRENNQNQKN